VLSLNGVLTTAGGSARVFLELVFRWSDTTNIDQVRLAARGRAVHIESLISDSGMFGSRCCIGIRTQLMARFRVCYRQSFQVSAHFNVPAHFILPLLGLGSRQRVRLASWHKSKGFSFLGEGCRTGTNPPLEVSSSHVNLICACFSVKQITHRARNPYEIKVFVPNQGVRRGL
jgi:hypothetical protein